MKIDWKRKLTSRKFWALIAGFVTGIIIFATSPEKSNEAVSGIIMSLGSIVAYIIGEGIADSNSKEETKPETHFTYDFTESEVTDNGISDT